MLFYVFNLLLQNYILTFDTVRQQIANLPLLPRARLFNSRTEGTSRSC